MNSAEMALGCGMGRRAVAGLVEVDGASAFLRCAGLPGLALALLA